MQVTILRNVGKHDLDALGVNDELRAKFTEQSVVDVPNDLGHALIERKLAESGSTVQGIAPPAPLQGTPQQPTQPEGQSEAGESPVKEDSAADAIDAISRMTSREKLEAIVAHDSRVTVQNAAKARLSNLPQ